MQHGRGVRRKGRFRVTDSGTDGAFGRRDRIRRHAGPDIEAANYAAKSLSVLRTDESAKQPSPIAGRRAQSRKMSKDHSRISRTEPVGLIPRHLHIRLLHTRQGCSALSYRLRWRHTVAGASSAAIYKYRYVITEDSAPTRGRRRHSRERVACGRSPVPAWHRNAVPGRARAGTASGRKTLKHSRSRITGGQNSRSPHRVGSAGSAAAERLLGRGATDRAPIKVRKQER